MMGDLNARIGNTKIMTILGTNGEPAVNNNGKKLFRLLYIQQYENHEQFLATFLKKESEAYEITSLSVCLCVSSP
jgi:hypothetical protein